ncbi:hypothetical protein ACMYSM_10130 [Raoultella planticola]
MVAVIDKTRGDRNHVLDIQPQEQRGGAADEKRKTARAITGHGMK